MTQLNVNHQNLSAKIRIIIKGLSESLCMN